MSITASVTSQPIAATVGETKIDVAVPQSATIAAAVSGGVGPTGPAGPASEAGSGGSTTNASLLTTGTIDDARLSFVPIHPFLLMGG